MTLLQLQSGPHVWSVDFADETASAADLFQALALGRLLDEGSGAPVAGWSRLACDRATLTPLVDGDGMIGWGGRPRAVWGAMAGAALACRATIDAAGFLPRLIDLNLPAQPGYPTIIQVLALGDIDLHRLPAAPRGRVVSAGGTPRAGAAVTVSGLWRRLADFVDETSPSTIGALAAVAPGTARFRAGAGLRARVRRLVWRPERVALLDDVLPGARRIRVAAGIPFVPGSASDVIGLPGEVGEIAHVVAVASPHTADEVLVELRHPLALAHGRGDEVRNARLTAAGPWSAIQHGVHEGDRCICLADGTVLGAPGDWLEIQGGGMAPEIRALTRVSATSDARGFFSLPPLHRAALIRLRATHGSEPAPGEAIFVLDTRLANARADIVFPP
jgi:hypothetical protein